MNYSLTKTDNKKEKDKGVLITALRRLVPLMAEEKRAVSVAIIAVMVTAASMLVVPIIIAHIVDVYMVNKDFSGVLLFSGLSLSYSSPVCFQITFRSKPWGEWADVFFLICGIKYLTSFRSCLSFL